MARMKKLLLLPFVACAIFVLALLVSSPAYSRGGGGGGRGFGGRDNGYGQEAPTPKPTPTPTPAPAPVQGVISNVTAFAVSIKTNPQAMDQTYKVGFQTTITVNNVPSTIGALKPGMIATITPAADNIYATSIVASLPATVAVATPAPHPPGSSSPQQQPPPSASTLPPGSAPFGTAHPIP